MRIDTGQMLPVLKSISLVIKQGLAVSAAVYLAHNVTCCFSRHLEVEAPDPTLYFRLFEKFFEEEFAPVGRTVATRITSPMLRKLSFQLSVGLSVILTAMGVYVVTAGAVVGTLVVAHQIAGFTFDPVPVFRQVVALTVVCSLAVMFHAAERAKHISAG